MGCVAGLEGLDDDHAAAATRAGLREGLSRVCPAFVPRLSRVCPRVIGLGVGFGFVLRRLYVEQLTGARQVLGTLALGEDEV